MKVVRTTRTSDSNPTPMRAESWSMLPTTVRAIRAENTRLLQRRRAFAVSQAKGSCQANEREVGKWFPGQQELLKMLSVCTDEDIEALAACDKPLFRIPLLTNHLNITPIDVLDADPDSLEGQTQREIILLLHARLDAIRLNENRATIDYDITKSERCWLGNKCTLDLEMLAKDAFMTPRLHASIVYFHAVLSKPNLSVERKTILCTLSSSLR